MNTRPNILIFFTDQQRWDSMGLNGNPMGLTPHLDRLARQGTFFSQAVTPQPVCGPCRSCIQTGQYATTTGVWKNGPGLKPDAPKLAECLKQAGYHTGYIGKWHLSEQAGHGAVPAEDRTGYDEWLGANAVELISGPYSARLWDGENKEVQLPGYRSDALVDASIRHLRTRAGDPEQPFLLCISFIEPHHQNTDDSYPAPHGMESTYRGGWLPPDLQALGGTSARDWSGYCAMIKRLDDGLGRIMDTLESTGQADHTVVCFISDHGCHFKTRNGEYKRSPHESSVRIPMAIWGPGWDGGGEQRIPASLVDLAPSLLETAGVSIPAAMQGRSLLPVTRGEDPGLEPEAFIQFGDAGLVPPGRALRTNRWKYAVTSDKAYINQGDAPVYQETHLYDLQTDPYELTNLVSIRSHAELRAHFATRLLERMQAVGEPPAEIVPHPDSSGSGHRMVEYPNSDRRF